MLSPLALRVRGVVVFVLLEVALVALAFVVLVLLALALVVLALLALALLAATPADAVDLALRARFLGTSGVWLMASLRLEV